MDLKANKREQLETAKDITRIIDRCTDDGIWTERQKDELNHLASRLAELVIAYHEARARGMRE